MEKIREATAYDHARMCNSLKCKDCPLYMASNDADVECSKFITEHYKDANAVIVKWCDEHPDMRWISVEERLPDYAKYVIVAYDSGETRMDFLTNDRFAFEDLYGKATHWIPMPKSPGGVK